MAHKKGEGKVKNGRDSESKRLGIKLFGGQTQRMLNQDLLQVYKKDGETICCQLSKPKQLLTTSLRHKRFKKLLKHRLSLVNGTRLFNSSQLKPQKSLVLTIGR